MEYKVVTTYCGLDEKGPAKHEQAVAALIADGWVPCGGIAFESYWSERDRYFTYSQAMVRGGDPSRNP